MARAVAHRSRKTAGVDRLKLGELVLYVAQKLAADPMLGATPLDEVLYFSDFAAFAMLGAPITGATYVRADQGPVARELPQVQRDLETRDEAETVESSYSGLRP